MPAVSRFAQAAASLHRATSKANGGLVTFTRPGVGSVDVTATYGKSTLVIDNGTAAGIEVISDDFIIQVADLVISGVALTPAAGDTITRAVGSTTQTFELMTPPYSPGDVAKSLFRIHTKLSNVE